ncbi:MAG: 4-hydroxy-tetrahydrodipicolinate synthase [Phycisphaerales bacterium JB039]
MTLRDERFSGCFTAIITPFTADGGAIDYGRLKAQIQRQADGGVRGIVVCGTTGESPTLSSAEYRELVERAIRIARDAGLLVIAGTGSNSTAHAVELQRLAAEAGADGGLSVNPYYNKPEQEGLYRHFMAVAEAADLPVMLYNIPGRTGVALAPATVERLFAHPNIVANKEATGSTDSATDILARCDGISLLSGDDSMTLPFLSVGGVGVVSVVSNVAPDRVSALVGSWLTGETDRARQLHAELFALCRVMFCETNPIPVKTAMKLLGHDTGALRLPMTDPRAETVDRLQGVLNELGR